MKKILSFLVITLSLTFATNALAADVYGRRFDQPRVYFSQASLNKGGVVTALKGQENFLRLYMPAVNKDLDLDPDALPFTVTLPASLRVLDDGGEPLAIKTEGDVQHVTGRFDPQQVRIRCMTNTWGVERILWFNVTSDAPAESPISVAMHHRGTQTWTDKGRLAIHEALHEPPAIDPARFKLWLHYGPHTRGDNYDALAHYLRKAGINAVQVMAWNVEKLRAMKKRGFYIIAQRGGSYHSLHEQTAEAAAQGPAWFEAHDGGKMREVIDDADAVIWDFEPTPAIVYDQPKLLAQFAAETGIKADVETIRDQHLDVWSKFTQKLYGKHVRAWADWSRSLRPDIETILTEGRCNIFDPMGQTDYRQIATDVTICDPMNFSGLNSIHGMQKWIAAAPNARFAGCQNVALHSYATVFASAQTIMLQTVSAALMGNVGTSVYPGQTMDAENFIHFNRAMTFLGKNQEAIFAGTRDPRDITLTLVPREDRQIDLGGGRAIRNIYPDWRSDAVTSVYRDASGGNLVVIANWNASEPCFARIERPGVTTQWFAVDDEHKQVYAAQNGTAVVRTPSQDFRGYRIVTGAAPAGYKTIDVTAALREYIGDGGGDEGSQQIGYDDINGDEQFEYVVNTNAQKVWIDQGGRIVRWQAGDATIETRGLGIGRDMLWLPAPERGNTAMDAPMKLIQRSADDDGVTITFERNVSLPGVGGQSSLVVEKRYAIAADRADITVSVNLAFNSLAAHTIDMSYRVHSHLPGSFEMWLDDGEALLSLAESDDVSVVNQNLSDAQRTAVFGGYPVKGPMTPARVGAYDATAKLLFTVVPHDPSDLMQVLRWVAGSHKEGTVEWMHLPATLEGAATWSTGYDMSLRSASALDRAHIDASLPRRVGKSDQAKLLFHVDFADNADAVTAAGEAQAMVSGDVSYESTPTGRGVFVGPDAKLAWFAQHNVDPMRGKLFMRFKPRWNGNDGKTHFLLTMRPDIGFVYFGKVNDGRLLLNQFDIAGGQHYPWAMARSWKADQWYEATVTWDAIAGRMALYVNGTQVAAHDGDPWEMSAFDDAKPHCRISIPADAEAVIDEIKVWDQP